MIAGSKILVTGATGEVARAISHALAPANEVWAIARFTDAKARHALEQFNIRTHAWTLSEGSCPGLPDDFDYVVHAAASIFEVGNDFDETIRVNAEGTGILMAHVRRAKGFLYISSTHAYSRLEDNSVSRKEGDDLGCFPFYAPSYSIGKVATEAVVRTMCRLLDLPVTIGRLGMNYGAGCSGGPDQALKTMLRGDEFRVPPFGKSWAPLVNNADIVAQVEPLLRAASVPATITNWAGDETVDEREMYEYMVAVSGIDAKLVEDQDAGYYGGVVDPTKRISITGPAQHDWKSGFREMLSVNYPELGVSAKG